MKGLGFTNQVWDVHIYGDVPQCIEVTAPTREAAINRVLSVVLARLEFKAEVQNPRRGFRNALYTHRRT